MRKAYLSAMKIDLWVLREARTGVPSGDAEVVSDACEIAPSGAERPPAPDRETAVADNGAPPTFDAVPLDAYADMPFDQDAEEDGPPVADREVDIAGLGWPALAQRVAECRDCALCESRTRTVFGVGDREARLMIVGEAPGADEDRQGEPFVGRAGQLLSAMLQAIGFKRNQVYIANVLKCRPPGNRDPHVQEVAACQPYLTRQIALVRPDLILSVGGVSAKNLLNTEASVGRLRGTLHRYAATGTPLLVTYHPAYLLRKPSEKAKVWRDLQQVHRYLHQEAEK